MEINKWYSILEAEKELRDKATYRLNGKTKAASIFGFDFSFKDNGLWITWPNGVDKTHIEGEGVFKLTKDDEVVRGDVNNQHSPKEELADAIAKLMCGVGMFPIDSDLNINPDVSKHLNDFGKELGQKPPKKDRFIDVEVTVKNKGAMPKKTYVSGDWCPLCSSEKPETTSDNYWQEQLWSWLNNENRAPAQTTFSAGRVRDIAREIELRLCER